MILLVKLRSYLNYQFILVWEMHAATSDVHPAFACQIEHRYRAQGMEKITIT